MSEGKDNSTTWTYQFRTGTHADWEMSQKRFDTPAAAANVLPEFLLKCLAHGVRCEVRLKDVSDVR